MNQSDNQASTNPTPLFSPEQMAEIQASVGVKLKADYIAENFIPVGLPPEDLFSRVMMAMASGVTRNPKTAAFISSQLICGIVQLCVPTMFVEDNIAAMMDDRVQALLHSEAELLGASTEHYQAIVQLTTEHASTQRILQSEDAYKNALTNHAQSISMVFGTLANHPFENAHQYRHSAVMKQVLMDEPPYDDRWLFETAYAPTKATPDSPDSWTPPAILGLDVLQFLAASSSGQHNVSEGAILGLMFELGRDAVNVGNDGQVNIDDKYADKAQGLMWPHREWLSQYWAIHPNWDAADDCAMIYPATVTAVASATEDSSDTEGKSLTDFKITFRDLPLASEHEFYSDRCSSKDLEMALIHCMSRQYFMPGMASSNLQVPPPSPVRDNETPVSATHSLHRQVLKLQQDRLRVISYPGSIAADESTRRTDS